MGKVVTLGEIMLRLSTPGNTRFVQSDSFDVVYGGGEANVAVSCANYGHEAYFVTKLPKHEIGQSAVNALRKYGVKTDFISRGGDRVGIIAWRELLIMMCIQIILKSMYEVIILPVTIRVVKAIKKIDGSDVYDTDISYNVLKVKDI